MQSDTHRVAVLGAGGWGTALAVHLGRSEHNVWLWGRSRQLMAEIGARRANPTYLPDVTLPVTVQPTDDIAAALDGADHVVVAVPSHGLRGVMREAAPHIPRGAILVSGTKGLETVTLRRMSEVMSEETAGRHDVVVLSGPSFAWEVANELPTALVAASVSPAAVESVQREFRGPSFRLYGSSDVAGVEIGASLKNIIAIAAGVVESMELGHNALAALITRGLAEISRLAVAVGGERETLAGLSGLGDLVLTCTGALSRNRHVGVELGKGRHLGQILAGMHTVAEGVRTTEAALALSDRYGVELPIAMQMAELLAGKKTPQAAVEHLMLRPQRCELEQSGS